MKIIIGLVVGNLSEEYRKKWTERWYIQALRLGDEIIVIDNSTDGTGEYFLNKPRVAFYLKQKHNERHMNRDYQRILDLGRSIKAEWILNIDIDEIIDPIADYDSLQYMIGGNSTPFEFHNNYRFLLFEMRDDENHYVQISGKDCRPVSKFYKVMTHLQFDMNNIHGSSVPENLEVGPIMNIKVKHLGHMTKDLREEKRNRYKLSSEKDILEQNADWLKEEGVTIKEMKENEWK
jgi:hypothetical protein